VPGQELERDDGAQKVSSGNRSFAGAGHMAIEGGGMPTPEVQDVHPDAQPGENLCAAGGISC